MHAGIMVLTLGIIHDGVVNSLHVTVHESGHGKSPHCFRIFLGFVLVCLLVIPFVATAKAMPCFAAISDCKFRSSRRLLGLEIPRITFKPIFLWGVENFHDGTFIFTCKRDNPKPSFLGIRRSLFSLPFFLF